jgi:hypothetical protein
MDDLLQLWIALSPFLRQLAFKSSSFFLPLSVHIYRTASIAPVHKRILIIHGLLCHGILGESFVSWAHVVFRFGVMIGSMTR